MEVDPRGRAIRDLFDAFAPVSMDEATRTRKKAIYWRTLKDCEPGVLEAAVEQVLASWDRPGLPPPARVLEAVRRVAGTRNDEAHRAQRQADDPDDRPIPRAVLSQIGDHARRVRAKWPLAIAHGYAEFDRWTAGFFSHAVAAADLGYLGLWIADPTALEGAAGETYREIEARLVGSGHLAAGWNARVSQ